MMVNNAPDAIVCAIWQRLLRFVVVDEGEYIAFADNIRSLGDDLWRAHAEMIEGKLGFFRWRTEGISGGFETGLVQQISITDGTDDGVGVWIGVAKNKNFTHGRSSSFLLIMY